MNTFEYKTTKQLSQTSTTIVRNIKNLNKNLQEFLGNFLISYNENKNNNPLNNLLQGIKQEKKLKGYIWKMKNWVESVSNYTIAYDKDKDYYKVKSTDKDHPEFIPNDLFLTTEFYTEEEKEKPDTSKFKDCDSATKTYDKFFEKLNNTEMSKYDRLKLFKHIKDTILVEESKYTEVEEE